MNKMLSRKISTFLLCSLSEAKIGKCNSVIQWRDEKKTSIGVSFCRDENLIESFSSENFFFNSINRNDFRSSRQREENRLERKTKRIQRKILSKRRFPSFVMENIFTEFSSSKLKRRKTPKRLERQRIFVDRFEGQKIGVDPSSQCFWTSRCFNLFNCTRSFETTRVEFSLLHRSPNLFRWSCRQRTSAENKSSEIILYSTSPVEGNEQKNWQIKVPKEKTDRDTSRTWPKSMDFASKMQKRKWRLWSSEKIEWDSVRINQSTCRRFIFAHLVGESLGRREKEKSHRIIDEVLRPGAYRRRGAWGVTLPCFWN